MQPALVITGPVVTPPPHAFIDFPSLASSSAAAQCGASGPVGFAQAAASGCAVDTPFEFVGDALVYGPAIALDPEPQVGAVVSGTFQVCGQEVSGFFWIR